MLRCLLYLASILMLAAPTRLMAEVPNNQEGRPAGLRGDDHHSDGSGIALVAGAVVVAGLVWLTVAESRHSDGHSSGVTIEERGITVELRRWRQARAIQSTGRLQRDTAAFLVYWPLGRREELLRRVAVEPGDLFVDVPR